MPRELSPTELEELGRVYCKQSNYQKALTAFTDGFNAGKTPDIKFLDMRAAIHERLGDLNSALKDGRQMIKLERRDTRGYLRTARVLQKLSKPDVALEIYKLGLKSCPTSDGDPNVELLRRMRDQLSRQLSPPKSEDPLAVLPAEIVDMVMGYLSFRQQVNCLRVSKHWKKFVESQPSLWTDLDLSLAKRVVRPAFVRSCIYRSKMGMESAKINRFFDETMILKLARSCKGLRSIQFVGSELSGASILEPIKLCRNLRELKLGRACDITLDGITQILKYAKDLTTAEFEQVASSTTMASWDTDLPNLRVLTVSVIREPRMRLERLNLRDLVTRAPNLTHLTAMGWKSETFVDLTALTRLRSLMCGDLFPGLPSSLETLTLVIPKLGSLVGLVNSIRSTELPVLQDLSLECGYMDYPDLVCDLLSHYENGQRVDDPNWTGLRRLRTCVYPEQYGQHLLRHPRICQVEELELIDAYGSVIDDRFLEQSISKLSYLHRLSIPNTRVTGAGLRFLIETMTGRADKTDSQHIHSRAKSSKTTPGGTSNSFIQKSQARGLEYLNIDHCSNVSPDAIEWIKRQGIELSHKTAHSAPKGKRIRYGD